VRALDMPSRSARLGTIAGVLAIILLWSGFGHAARVVSIEAPLPEGEKLVTVKDRALEQGFSKAVYYEALAALPGQLRDDRKQALEQYLAPRAKDYVLGYREQWSQTLEDRVLLGLEVNINRQKLEKTLRELGLFATLGNPLTYTLRLSGADEEDRNKISSLETLSGLVDVMGGTLVLTLEKDDRGVWQGRLSTGHKTYSEWDADLEVLWAALWGPYFLEYMEGAGISDTVVLEVVGWPDIGQAMFFDREMAAWRDAVEESSISAVEVLAEGYKVRWKLKIKNREILEQKLAESLAGRDLAYFLVAQ